MIPSELQAYIDYVTGLVEDLVGPLTDENMADEYKKLEDAGYPEIAEHVRQLMHEYRARRAQKQHDARN